MNQIIISDKNQVETEVNFDEVRFKVRGIVLNQSKEILIENFKRYQLFSLPGGEMDIDESPAEAFLREVKEETGYACDIISQLKTVVELRHKQKYKQINYIFLAEVRKEKEKQLLDFHEKVDGLSIKWYPFFSGMQLLMEQVSQTEQQQFLMQRDRVIMHEALLEIFGESELFLS